MVVLVALAALWCAVATVLLSRGPGLDDVTALARRWFAWASGVGAAMLVGTLVARAVGDGHWLWPVLVSAGTLASGACAYQGLIHLHRRPSVTSRVEDWSIGFASLLALVAAGNATAARLWTETGLHEQAWIVQIATWLLVLGTATSLLGLTGLGRRLRAWVVVAGLWLLFALHLTVVAATFGDATGLAAALGTGPVMPLGWAGCATAALLATRRSQPGLVRPASASSIAAGAAAVVASSLAVVVADAALAGGPTPLTVVLGAVSGTLGVARLGAVVRELSRLAESRVEARTDVLTGLANRRGFMESLTDACDAEEPTGLVILDLDGFKEVNDTLGHAGGDLYIAALAARFREAVPAPVALARIGGDEFAAVVRQAADPDAVAQALLDTTHEPIEILGRTLRLGASAGVARAAAGELAAEELMRRADAAMYVTKRSGGGLRPYDERLDASTRTQQHLLRGLRALLDDSGETQDHGDLVLHYQPQVDVESGGVRGAEALVRWEHPRLGLLYPGAFLPLVEEHGLTMALTRRVLSMAAAHAAVWPEDLAVSVNVAAADIGDDRAVAAVDAALGSSGLAARRLTLEITETMLLRDPAASSALMRRLRRRGVRFSLDDYGTGYSSLTHLRELPVDEIKVDRAFVAQLSADERTRAIVDGTVRVAHGIGMTVVGEGVEDAATLAALREVGCDVSQGFLHAAGLPEVAFRAWCEAQRQATISLPTPTSTTRGVCRCASSSLISP